MAVYTFADSTVVSEDSFRFRKGSRLEKRQKMLNEEEDRKNDEVNEKRNGRRRRKRSVFLMKE